MIPKTHRQLLGWGSVAIIAGMPFHAFLVTWAGHVFGNRELWQSWKEILIISMVAIAIDGLRRKPQAIKRLLTPLNYLVVAFTGIALLVTLIATPLATPALFGFKITCGFLVLFLCAQLATARLSKVYEVLVYAGAFVSVLGLIQVMFLGPEWLATFGYSPQTIYPFQQVGSGAERAFSTLGGPNQLGAFLILPAALALRFWLQNRSLRWGAALGFILACLYHSHSRSAWLGTAAALGLILWLELPKLRALLVTSVILLSIAVAYVATATDILHHGGGTDELHLIAVQDGITQSLQNPLGKGLGTAGPASFRGSEGLIPENYYLQVAIETGWLGLIVFMALQSKLALMLWAERAKSGPQSSLLAALLGIGVVNLFLHGWADSSTALTYWALAGLTVGNHD